MKKRIIKLLGEVNQEMADYVFNEVLEIIDKNLNSNNPTFEDIVLIINSTKGDFDQAAAIHNILKLIPNKKIAVIIGNSCDATNYIFLSCDERYATNLSRLIFEDITQYSGYIMSVTSYPPLELITNIKRNSPKFLIKNDDIYYYKFAKPINQLEEILK